MKVRLKDIAEATGYSINTISHALRDEPDISEATKARIRKVAAELDYIPNLRASSIKSGKSRIISIILPDIINPHFTIVFREIEEFFRKHGITPFFMNTNENIEEEMNAVRLSIAQNVDGVIICPCQKGTETIELLERSGVPFVLIGRHFGAEINTHYVVCDDKGGAQMAINHLISMGHRSIAFVKADSPISSNTERFEGYKQALNESNIPFNEDIILTLPLTGGENKAKIREFIKANPQCTAIVAFSDILAYEVINTLNSLGISVPEEVSVIGFDNICSDYTLPLQLTSISISKKNMAHKACKILQTLMSKKDTEMQSSEKMQVVLPTCVFIRETTKRKE